MRFLILAGCAGALAACAHSPHHGDMTQMCAEHRQSMAGKSPAEQRAAAEAQIRAMHGTADAAHVERHLRMMEQRCGPTPAR